MTQAIAKERRHRPVAMGVEGQQIQRVRRVGIIGIDTCGEEMHGCLAHMECRLAHLEGGFANLECRFANVQDRDDRSTQRRSDR